MPVQSTTIFALAAAGLGAASAGNETQQPVVFVTAVEQPGAIIVQVRGLAEAPFAGRYTLDTVSGSNRVHQSGSIRLEPEKPATFMTLSLSPNGAWSAVLRVEPENGAAYDQKLGNS